METKRTTERNAQTFSFYLREKIQRKQTPQTSESRLFPPWMGIQFHLICWRTPKTIPDAPQLQTKSPTEDPPQLFPPMYFHGILNASSTTEVGILTPCGHTPSFWTHWSFSTEFKNRQKLDWCLLHLRESSIKERVNSQVMEKKQHEHNPQTLKNLLWPKTGELQLQGRLQPSPLPPSFSQAGSPALRGPDTKPFPAVSLCKRRGNSPPPLRAIAITVPITNKSIDHKTSVHWETGTH